MTLTMIHPFSEVPVPALNQIGGKALSLTRMTQSGLPVPSGFVCTVGFFQPWLDALQATKQWDALRTAIETEEGLHSSTEALKEVCGSLLLSPEQGQALSEALDGFADDSLLAVRSSSPEEDLAGASFAGGYETCLGVTKDGILEALRRAFASAFDERVFVYKKQHGFSVENPRIAVAIQRQIASESAGVGFSLNPLNNDYDEVVINANFGLGESVVSGRVSPDQFVVDKVSRKIVKRQRGSKEWVVFLNDEGGTAEHLNDKASEYCLSEDQVLAISKLLVRIEALYEMPMDIEWAFSEERLYLLQARPITTHVPLPPEMATKPGEKRRLYFDVGLVDVMTINQPMTPLTIDWMFRSIGMWITPFIGPVKLNARGAPGMSLLFAAGGRTYVNLSQVLTLIDVRRFSGSGGGASQMDALTAQLMANVDVERYKADKKIPSLRWLSLLRHLPRALLYMTSYMARVLYAIWRPQQFYRRYERVIRGTVRKLQEDIHERLTLREMIVQLNDDLTPIIGKTAAPPMSAYMNYMMKYMGSVDRLVRNGTEEDKQLAEDLSRGFSGNEATNIGIQLHRMAKMLKSDDLVDLDNLARRIKERALPDKFMSVWDEFVVEFGARGPNELELSNARYGDEPLLALEQMSYMADTDYDPEKTQREHATARRRAYETLLTKLRGRQRRTLERVYRILDLYGPARDTPKYLWVLNNGAVRRRALLEGRKFVDSGRLDVPEDIFWLTLPEIDAANADPSIDLRQLRDKKKPFYDKLDQVVTFPHLIDSRGRIGQVKQPKSDPNTLVGQGISNGRAVGRIKVLHKPREKPIEKGDVLVTYTTDPGWTPLFVNAEAVILEIGGMLQHGGVVAREYGKPCVVGIQGITKTLKDGQLVEVDGAIGTVRLLESQMAI